MATAPIRIDLGSTSDGAIRRDARLAELVAGLCACDDDAALDAVRSHDDAVDPLEVVARAITGLRHGTTETSPRHGPAEPQDRFRVAGFLRDRNGSRLPRRPSGTASVSRPVDRAEYHLVHHGSLRRWERVGTDDPDAPDLDGDGEVIDLRDRTARFRRPHTGS